jgi:hypothetical protein
MCLIIDRPQGVAIPRALLTNAISDNPDGWGIMLARRGRLETHRGLDAPAFFTTLDELGDDPLTIHFRWATHGLKDLDNCHPFPVCGGAFALMHNGVIGDAPEFDASRSDTWHFAHYLLEPMLLGRPDWFGKPELEQTLGSLVGGGNKLVILRADGETSIVNRKAGTEWEGLWLSNSSSIPGKKPWLSAATWARSRARDVQPISLSDLSDDDFVLWSRDTKTAGTSATDDADSQWMTLEDVAYMDDDDIIDWMLESPSEVLDLIRDHFA